MMHTRTAMLLGDTALEHLKRKKVIVFGLGGVGGHLAEALCRTGIGTIGLVDGDVVEESNLNRQLVALRSTLGMSKVCVMASRIADIDPGVAVVSHEQWLNKETLADFELENWDYIADAIDDVPAKLLLIETARAAGIPVISCMGTGFKLDPSRLCVADISETHECPLARAMRKELRSRGISNLKVIYSAEKVRAAGAPVGAPASATFVPAAAGLMIASEIVRDLLRW